MAALNENCEDDEIILTENECRVAANALGLIYKGVCTEPATNCNQRPAGCYTMLRIGARDTYHNMITNPSNLYPAQQRAGVCRRQSKLLCHIISY